MDHIKPNIRAAYHRELMSSREALKLSNFSSAWRHLERAHILSQPFAMAHFYVHIQMLRLAFYTADFREVMGQIPRIVLAIPASVLGKAPIGNPGRANVGMFTPMKIPDDLERN